MSEGVVVIVATTVVLVVLAIFVVVAVAISRRPAATWQDHLREQTARVQEFVQTPSVTPTETTIEELLATENHDGAPYINAEEIPGYSHLEQVAEKVEKLQAARRA